MSTLRIPRLQYKIINNQDDMPPPEARNSIVIGSEKSNLVKAQEKELQNNKYDYVQGP